MCRNGVRKGKAKLEQDLARDVKKNKKGFNKYLGQKTKAKKSVPPLEARGANWWQLIWRRLNEFFTSAFTGSQASCFSQVLILCVGVGEVESLLL